MLVLFALGAAWAAVAEGGAGNEERLRQTAEYEWTGTQSGVLVGAAGGDSVDVFLGRVSSSLPPRQGPEIAGGRLSRTSQGRMRGTFGFEAQPLVPALEHWSLRCQDHKLALSERVRLARENLGQDSLTLLSAPRKLPGNVSRHVVATPQGYVAAVEWGGGGGGEVGQKEGAKRGGGNGADWGWNWGGGGRGGGEGVRGDAKVWYSGVDLAPNGTSVGLDFEWAAPPAVVDATSVVVGVLAVRNKSALASAVDVRLAKIAGVFGAAKGKVEWDVVVASCNPLGVPLVCGAMGMTGPEMIGGKVMLGVSFANVIDPSGTLYAIDPASGKIQWHATPMTPTTPPLPATLISDPVNPLVQSTDKHDLVCVTASVTSLQEEERVWGRRGGRGGGKGGGRGGGRGRGSKELQPNPNHPLLSSPSSHLSLGSGGVGAWVECYDSENGELQMRSEMVSPASQSQCGEGKWYAASPPTLVTAPASPTSPTASSILVVLDYCGSSFAVPLPSPTTSTQASSSSSSTSSSSSSSSTSTSSSSSSSSSPSSSSSSSPSPSSSSPTPVLWSRGGVGDVSFGAQNQNYFHFPSPALLPQVEDGKDMLWMVAGSLLQGANPAPPEAITWAVAQFVDNGFQPHSPPALPTTLPQAYSMAMSLQDSTSNVADTETVQSTVSFPQCASGAVLIATSGSIPQPFHQNHQNHQNHPTHLTHLTSAPTASSSTTSHLSVVTIHPNQPPPCSPAVAPIPTNHTTPTDQCDACAYTSGCGYCGTLVSSTSPQHPPCFPDGGILGNPHFPFVCPKQSPLMERRGNGGGGRGGRGEGDYGEYGGEVEEEEEAEQGDPIHLPPFHLPRPLSSTPPSPTVSPTPSPSSGARGPEPTWIDGALAFVECRTTPTSPTPSPSPSASASPTPPHSTPVGLIVTAVLLGSFAFGAAGTAFCFARSYWQTKHLLIQKSEAQSQTRSDLASSEDEQDFASGDPHAPLLAAFSEDQDFAH